MRRSRWAAFAVLCVLSGSRWLLAEVFPSPLSMAAEGFLRGGFLALVLGVGSVIAGGKRASGRMIVPVLLAFPVPALAFAVAEGHIPATTQTVVFAFTPAVVVFALTQGSFRFGPESEVRAKMIPALAGVLGMMLLIPASLPPAWPALVFVVAAMIAAGLAAVRLHSELQGGAVLPTAALIAASTAIALGGLAHPMRWREIDAAREVLIALLVDGPILLLSVYLLREMSPVPFASRFLVIPLLAIFQGLAMLRPHPTPTLAAGVALIVFGASMLLRDGESETV